MDLLIKKIKESDKSLVISPPSYHVPIMLTLNKGERLHNVKFLSREKFITSTTFDIAEESIILLSQILDLTPTVLEEVLDYLPYIHENDATNTDVFTSVKRALEEKKLIEDSAPFEMMFKGRKIYIYGYPVIDKLFLKLLNNLDASFKYEILKPGSNLDKTPLVKFHSEYEEVEYLCNTLSQKLSEGVNPTNIKVHSTNSSYNSIISTLFHRFNLVPYFSQPKNLMSFNITNRVLKMILKSEKNIKETLLDIYSILERTLSYQSEHSNKIFTAFISVLNKYILFDGKLSDYINLIEYDLKKATIRNERFVSSIFIGNLTSEFIDKDDLVIILGFNEGSIPKVTKNNRILDDSVLEKIGAETSIHNTLLSKSKYTDLMMSNNIEYVSYSTHSLTSEKIVSTLSFELLKNNKLYDCKATSFANHYSIDHDLITLGKMISDTKEYGIITESLPTYANSVLNNTVYPDRFVQKSGLAESNLIKDLLKNIPSLSYSSISDYFKCEFKFLLKKGLKVPETFGDRLPMIIGDLFHKTLQGISTIPEAADERNAFFSDVLKSLIEDNEYVLTLKEKFYLTHSFSQLTLVVDWINDIHQKTEYTALHKEKEYVIPLNGEFIKEFKGVIDVVMALDDKFFVIDYKTGSTLIDISNLEFGLQSQLIFYLYLVTKAEENLSSPSGFFYSPIYSRLMNAVDEKSYNELLFDSWKLDGYISEEKLVGVDPNYREKSFIKGVSTKKNGELKAGAKILSTREQVSLINHLDSLLEKAVLDIENGHFNVNPKGNIDSNESCSYCEYKDICFRSKENFIEKSTIKKNSLLYLEGGEQDDTN